jgi:hypothetical protein
VTTAVALEVHPLAELIPPMTAEEYAEHKADIESNGLLSSITLYEDKILDGRHRYRACSELGIEPGYIDYEGDDPASYVISLNLHRRHLTTGQKAHAALALLDYEKEKAKERQAHGKTAPGKTLMQNSAEAPDHKAATAEAGKRLGVSRDSVEKARRIAKQRPDLAEKVKSGEISLNAAVEEQLGYSTAGGRSNGQSGKTYFGKGDKWQESTEPLARYLASWAKRNYEFAHLNYREAAKRTKRIDNLIAGLEAARSDLEPRTQKAKLTL